MFRYLQTENAGFVIVLEMAGEQGVGGAWGGGPWGGTHLELAQCGLPTITANFLNTPMQGAMSV